jgi:hypothetical protein
MFTTTVNALNLIFEKIILECCFIAGIQETQHKQYPGFLWIEVTDMPITSLK